MYHTKINNCIKALLSIGSALIFVYCGDSGGSKVSTTQSRERLMTESSDNFSVTMSENGRPSYIFSAPKVEGYTLATEPYREFNKGVEIITFKDDSMNMRDGKLTANYAIYYENRKLWEAVGDVVVTKADGKELYSQQLFWNALTKRIYSNVDTKIMDRESGDVYIGEGFESDEAMEEWSFRKMKGRMKMNVEPRQGADEADSLAQGGVVDSLAREESLEN
ncbi:MAG: LPS export ABC transporter periplasmic protein LptC [Rikenellaceae bacterium]